VPAIMDEPVSSTRTRSNAGPVLTVSNTILSAIATVFSVTESAAEVAVTISSGVSTVGTDAEIYTSKHKILRPTSEVTPAAIFRGEDTISTSLSLQHLPSLLPCYTKNRVSLNP
jgi:hypothetical protein